MPEWTLKYADARGEMHQQVAEGASERELRERLTNQGFLVYSVKPRNEAGSGLNITIGSKSKKINLEKFLIFNQQFVTLIRAGLPILKSLDLLAERLTDPKLSRHVKAVREEVRNGAMLSDAFARQGVFPGIYVTSVLAGERSGSLPEVLERFITYQRLALSVRKKLLVSLMYPSVLIFLALCLIVFLVTYVVPNFAVLYTTMGAQLPAPTQLLIALGTTARSYVIARIRRDDRGDYRVPVLVENRVRPGSRGPGAAENAAGGRGMAEVSGGAIFARAGHAASGRNPLDAGAGDRLGFAGHASAETRAGAGLETGAGGTVALAIATRRPSCSRAFRWT